MVLEVWLFRVRFSERGKKFLNQNDKSLKDSEHGFYTIYNRGEKNTRYSKSSFFISG